MSMGKIREAAVHCLERAAQGTKAEDTDTVEATAAEASRLVTTTEEAMNRPNLSSPVPICSTPETFRIFIVGRSKCRAPIHVWVCRESTIREK